MKADTIFDLSSLTKPLATTTAIMLLVREGKIRLDDRVTRFFPNFGVHGKIHVTVRSLLAHCSGPRGLASLPQGRSSASRSRAA
jgi:CubicO group peptidase (beta-lactamase class C family)